MHAIVSEVSPANPIRCPACAGYDVRRSYPGGLRDWLMGSLGRIPLRCRGCRYRFYRKLRPGDTLGIPEPAVPAEIPVTVPESPLPPRRPNETSGGA
jgi:DNA-directed RNA polymerase subunit RPC12/RpoP